ncbi:MAG: winged helix DNA-binding domain-containing protein [Paenibacillaceae bacterium]
MQPALDRGLMGNRGRNLTSVDFQELAIISRELVEEQPRTWGIWGTSGQAIHTSAENWLGQTLDTEYELNTLIFRYLRAFGPATVADVQVWSGLTRIREVIERLRPRLRTFLDKHGNELFDVPDAELPDADTPVPVRFLAEYDNMLLSYKDRTRIIAEEYRKRTFTVNGIIKSTILVDGFVQGVWDRASEKLSNPCYRNFYTIVAARKRRTNAKLLEFAAADTSVRNIQFL